MTKTQIKKELLAYTGRSPFISVSDLAKALHIGRDRARTIVTGLEYIPHGSRKDYLIDEVAQHIVSEARVMGGDSSRKVDIGTETRLSIEDKWPEEDE